MKPEDLPTFLADQLTGPGVVANRKRVTDLSGVFANDIARAAFDPQAIAYEVQMHQPVPEGTEAGLFFGISHLNPGTVGGEFFMTRGHFHAKSDRCEYYWGIAGTGLLLLMSRDRAFWTQVVKPGSLHFIPGHTAHRLINTGPTRLSVGACWPSDAGHDYDAIAREGFSARVFDRNGNVSIEPWNS
jgi:glucose-6-phosphate isomerase, archaeal